MRKNILKLVLCDFLIIAILVLFSNACINIQGMFNFQFMAGKLNDLDGNLLLYIDKIIIDSFPFYATPIMAFIFSWAIQRFCGDISRTRIVFNAMIVFLFCMISYFVLLNNASGTIFFPQDLLLFPAVCICFFIVHILTISLPNKTR